MQKHNLGVILVIIKERIYPLFITMHLMRMTRHSNLIYSQIKDSLKSGHTKASVLSNQRKTFMIIIQKSYVCFFSTLHSSLVWILISIGKFSRASLRTLDFRFLVAYGLTFQIKVSVDDLSEFLSWLLFNLECLVILIKCILIKQC